MKPHVALVLTLLAGPVQAAAPCLDLDGEKYCLAWAAVDGPTTSNEYLRSGESVEKWVRMVTVKEYAGTKEVADFLKPYMDSVRPYLAMKADLVQPKETKHKSEYILLLLLLAPDKSHYEYVVHRTYVDEGGPVRSVIFSLRIPFAKHVSFDEVMNNRWRWAGDLGKLEPQPYKAIPKEGSTSDRPPSN